MTSTTFDARLGAEDLQLDVLSALVRDLNTAIDKENTRAATAIDAAFETLTNRGLGVVVAEHVDSGNFHMGHRPSAIMAPADHFPFVSVMCYTTQPTPLNAGMDHTQEHAMLVSIESIVKSDPVADDDFGDSDGEEVVERRVKRTAEAISKVMAVNRELSGYCWPTTSPPVVTFGEVEARQQVDNGLRQRYFWAGVRFQFVYSKTDILFGLSVDQV